jgi:hypothetical protein
VLGVLTACSGRLDVRELVCSSSREPEARTEPTIQAAASDHATVVTCPKARMPRTTAVHLRGVLPDGRGRALLSGPDDHRC